MKGSGNGLARYILALWALVRKDFLLEKRGFERLIVTTGFSLLVIVMFHFAFDIGTGEAARFFPGAMWTALFFSATVGINHTGRSAGGGGEDTGLLLIPFDRSILFVSKLIFHLGLLLFVELIAVPLFIASFGLTQIASPMLFVLALLLGTWGLAALGTVFGNLTAGMSGSGTFLPLLLFPLLVPIALGASAIVTSSISGDITSVTWSWVKLLLFFDLLFTVIPALFYEYVLEV